MVGFWAALRLLAPWRAARAQRRTFDIIRPGAARPLPMGHYRSSINRHSQRRTLNRSTILFPNIYFNVTASWLASASSFIVHRHHHQLLTSLPPFSTFSLTAGRVQKNIYIYSCVMNLCWLMKKATSPWQLFHFLKATPFLRLVFHPPMTTFCVQTEKPRFPIIKKDLCHLSIYALRRPGILDSHSHLE